MCFAKSPPQDNSAAIARQQEQERQTKIADGRGRIDTAFEGFDDPYFAGVESSYGDYYQPQLTDQYNDARRALTLRLGNKSGGVNSSAGARAIGDLTKTYADNQALIGDRAISAGNSARSDVESNRNSLYAENRAAGDPNAAASSAAARAGMVSAAPSYNPLGDIFASAINSATTGLQAEKAGYQGFGSGLFDNGGNSSARVIR